MGMRIVKRRRRDIDMRALERKSEAFFAKNPTMKSRKTSFAGLSLDDI